MLIYKLRNKLNNNFYIGMTSGTLEARWKSHCDNVTKGKTKIYKAMRSYGIDNFCIELVESCHSQQHMEEQEDYYLRTLAPHYNMRLTGGTGGDTSYTENHINARDKMRASAGTTWYNNGVDQKRLTECPEGWVKGRLFKQGKHPNKIVDMTNWTCQACGKSKQVKNVKKETVKKYCNLKCNALAKKMNTEKKMNTQEEADEWFGGSNA